MKNSKIFGIIVLFAVIGFSVSGCAMLSSVGGSADPHGFFTGNGASNAATEGAAEIASYSVILGLVDAGYQDYAAKVKEAEAAGKQIITVTKWMFVLTKTTAYAK